MTTPSYIIPNLKGEPTFASNIPGFRSLVGPEQWHYCAELMPQVIEFLVRHAGVGTGIPMRPTLVGETLEAGDYILRKAIWSTEVTTLNRCGATKLWGSNGIEINKFGWTAITTRPMPEPPPYPLIEKIEQLLNYPMDTRARVLLTLALDIERGKATAQ